MKTGELAQVTEHLAVMVRLGLPLPEGLKSMGAPELTRMGLDLEAGDTLGAAAARQFSPFYAAMVAAAEDQPRPDLALSDLARWLERAHALQVKVRTALLYPSLVLSLLAVEVAIFALWVYPAAIAPLARMTHTTWLERAPGLLLPLGLLAGAAFVLVSLDRLFPALKLAQQSLWARAMAALLSTGVSLPEAARRATSLGLSVTAELERGATLTQATATRGLDPILQWAVAAGEDREELAAVLLEAAEELEAEVDRRAELALRTLEPLALAAAGAAVLLGLALFWGPYYSLLVRVPGA